MVGVQDMGKLAWQNSAAYFTAFCLSVHAAPSQLKAWKSRSQKGSTHSGAGDGPLNIA